MQQKRQLKKYRIGKNVYFLARTLAEAIELKRINNVTGDIYEEDVYDKRKKKAA